MIMKNLGLCLIFLFLISCGYSSIYQSNQISSFKIDTITISGDKKIGKSISEGIGKFKETQSTNTFDLDLIITKRNIIVSKDKRGNASSYDLIIKIDMNLRSEKSIKSIKRKFIKNTTYNSMDNKFELNQYKIDLEKNMTSQILQDIIIFLRNIDNDF